MLRSISKFAAGRRTKWVVLAVWLIAALLLGPLQPEVSRVNLGAQKGVFYRLLAGPLPSQAEAERVCRELKAKRQFCEVAFMGGGSALGTAPLAAPVRAPVRAAAPPPPPPPPPPKREAMDDSGN